MATSWRLEDQEAKEDTSEQAALVEIHIHIP